MMCDQCGSIKKVYGYYGKAADGRSVNILLCDKCFREYMSSATKLVNHKDFGYVYDLIYAPDLLSGGTDVQAGIKNSDNVNQNFYLQRQNNDMFSRKIAKFKWTGFVKILNYIVFILLLLAGVIIGIAIIGELIDNVFLGFLLGIVIGAVIGGMYICVSMMFVEISENIATLVEQNEKRNNSTACRTARSIFMHKLIEFY